MRRQDLIPGREYYVENWGVPRGRARLLRIGSNVHTFEYAEKPDEDGISRLVEVRVRSRDIKREWTEADDRRVEAGEQAKLAEQRLVAALDRVFGDLGGVKRQGDYGVKAAVSVSVRVRKNDDGTFKMEPHIWVVGEAEVKLILDALAAFIPAKELTQGQKILLPEAENA